MKRLVKHQPERLDSVVGFACACSTNCGCSCNCPVSCTCTCTGTTSAFTNQKNGSYSDLFRQVYGGVNSSSRNNVNSNVSTNVSLWG